ncbi:cyclic nucleotide-binding protein [Methylotenera oryzisoli]|jgi:CRP-like cAMP-binding protein/thioredoxin reductase/Pyruvate/2-oxoacid:ferredoxin oxidoreductase delta subunit|uniref:Cyclic nucleotide-binding protein n=1 Tax=Methylotenera oryzisoli TaxID=2080758 RepID=A0A4Y9VRJ3_9PROT|nr:cyclic nucleotide-binding domain-containing protein [Methylotenera oryzisoli]TFW71645.1 cyclic nucleotide-binding protein [Methylotenera oryzisoli]
MRNHFDVIIIGAGPSGLSAAARAAEQKLSYLLLEATEAAANTIRNYQRRKLVMAEPRGLPLRSPLPFAASLRESVLNSWESVIADYKINIRYNSKVVAITRDSESKRPEALKVELGDGSIFTADHVILAIGVQGNLRKLEIPGGDLPQVQYQLDDPEAYQNETIVVIGGGDTGVENALALTGRNQVIVLNRAEDFSNCKESNLTQLTEARQRGALDWLLETRPQSIEANTKGEFPVTLFAETPKGIERIPCHRIIARLGALPSRPLLESFGVAFPTADLAALPVLTPRYESNVPGLYIIGALAGYPLIKQGINQGYEVIEHILGNPVEAADTALLREKFASFCSDRGIEDVLDKIQRSVPLLRLLNSLQLRELILESNILLPAAGDIIFERNDYSTSFFFVIEGELEMFIDEDDIADDSFKSGEFFGEMGLLSGRRRIATVRATTQSALIETPRRVILKLINSVQAMRRTLDEVAIKRIVHACIGLSLSEDDLNDLASHAVIKQYAAGEELFHEGDDADGLYLIRRGSVTVSRMMTGREVVLFYVAAGNYVGEMSLISGEPRYATVRAAIATEAILIDVGRMQGIIARNPEVRASLDARYLQHLQEQEKRQQLETSSDSSSGFSNQSAQSSLISFLIQQGVGEATDVLLIDESLCVRCNHCEQACADTHGGATRLDRDTGPIYANIRVPTSCRHCEHPHCMKDCPPDAIHRAPHGEVYIDDSCIGCGNCQQNCPYDVIQMAVIQDQPEQSLWQMLLGIQPKQVASTNNTKVAVKCDMCKDIADGPVCVRACPVGAALRVNPEQLLGYASNNVADEHHILGFDDA